MSRQCLTSVILPTTTSPTSPLNLHFNSKITNTQPLQMHSFINPFKICVCLYVDLATVEKLHFSHVPCLEWSDTDELVYSLHLSSDWGSQLVFINIRSMTPGENKRVFKNDEQFFSFESYLSAKCQWRTTSRAEDHHTPFDFPPWQHGKQSIIPHVNQAKLTSWNLCLKW